MSEDWIAMPLSALSFALQLANEERTTSLDESRIRRRPTALNASSSDRRRATPALETAEIPRNAPNRWPSLFGN